MSIQAVEQRIKELLETIEKSAANHNFLVGSLNEAKSILNVLTSNPATDTAIVEKVASVVSEVSTVAEVIEPIL